jgi:hypothetical protein
VLKQERAKKARAEAKFRKKYGLSAPAHQTLAIVFEIEHLWTGVD